MQYLYLDVTRLTARPQPRAMRYIKIPQIIIAPMISPILGNSFRFFLIT